MNEKKCECGCGEATPIAKANDRRRGHVKGQPIRFISGHNGKLLKRFFGPYSDEKKCECGCGLPAPNAKGTWPRYRHVIGQPIRFRPGHNFNKSEPMYVVEMKGYNTPCWIWKRSLVYGYGCLRRAGRTRSAHVEFYVTKHGPVPEGTELDHLCRNRACVNPDHLEPVTRQVNTQRGGRAKLNPQAVLQIREMRAEGMSVKGTARKFGVTRRTIRQAASGASWGNV